MKTKAVVKAVLTTAGEFLLLIAVFACIIYGTEAFSVLMQWGKP